ncbi:MAG: translation initiation factor Sui1 [Pseudomonadales bacterium]
MSRKKSAHSGLVYSTDAGRMCPQCLRPVAGCVCKGKSKPAPPADSVVRISRQTKGRKGAGVTLISGLPLATAELQALAKQLKKKCGVGGAIKDSVIELQGDQRELAKSLLQDRWTVKISGG